VEESGALHYKNNEKSIIPNPQIEQGDKQDCGRSSIEIAHFVLIH
jgi:hypothetical protein